MNEILKIIKSNWLPIGISLAAGMMVLGFMPLVLPVYYLVLIAIAVYSLTQGGRLNILMILFYLGCALSIVISRPPAIFQSWPRLALFIAVTIAFFPVMDNGKVNRLRWRILLVTLWVSAICGVGSFFCYLLGINFATAYTIKDMLEMVGLFGGLFRHSMMLGPIAGSGALFLVFLYVTDKRTGKNRKYLLLTGAVLCALAVILSASRAALLSMLVGIALFIYLVNGRVLGKFSKRIIYVVAVAVLAYPLYNGFTGMLVEKQTRNLEAGDTFSSRTEKWENRLDEFKEHPIFGYGYAAVDWSKEDQMYINSSGVVEPGSTWLAVFSMTGIAGAIPFYLLIGGIIIRLWRYEEDSKNPVPALLISLLALSIVHQFAEGYALSAGSYFAFWFWLLLGVCSFYPSQDDNLPDQLIKI